MRRGVVVMGVVLAIGALVGCGDDDNAAGTSTSTPTTATSGNCTTSSLSGSYGVEFVGHSASLGKFASVSLWTFDGKDGMTSSENYTSDATGPQEREISGKYVIDRDCRFTLSFASELGKPHEADGVCILTESGREFICLDNEEGWVATGRGTKV